MQRVGDDAARSSGPEGPREWTEEEYAAGERTSDRIVGLWFLVITGATALGALVRSATGSDAAVVLVAGSCVGAFLLWASRRTKDLPPQRQAMRPVSPGLLALFLLVLAAAVVLAIVYDT
jgi:hypothetical protein